jgi:lysylphosphatidylglycerol synthetase-like protein (DUF2156 family)
MVTTSLEYASFFAFLTGLSGYFKNNKKLKLFHFILVLVAEEVIPLKTNKLRIVRVIPNVFCYLIFIVFSAFVVTNWKGLEEINRLSIWVIVMLVLLAVSIFGSYRIWAWIKEGKL